MIFPNITDYKIAIQKMDIRTDHLKHLKSINNKEGMPIGFAGNFAVVFQMLDQQTKEKFAIKCFTKQQPERKERYIEISHYIKQLKGPYFCKYEYFDKEFSITPHQGKKEILYPVLKMAWVKGKTLGTFLKKTQDPITLEKLYQNWIKLSQFLQINKMAHGDLKHDNMLISDSTEITLIDYDGIFVPNLSNKKALELGSPNYQHPNRSSQHFNISIDYFPQLIIAISIKALFLTPHLFKKYNTGENILFLKKDFLNLTQSALYQELVEINNAELNHLLKELHLAIVDFNYKPSFLTKPKVDISKTKPLYFIFNIDYYCRIDKGNGILQERIKSIIIEKLIYLNHQIMDKKSILFDITEYYNLKKIKSKNNRLINIEKAKNIFKFSENIINFEKSLEIISNKIKQFKQQYPKAQSPIIINIIANKNQPYLQDKISQIKQSAHFYNIYISDTLYNPLLKYPIKLNNETIFYQNLVKSSSLLDKETRHYLTNKYQENLMKESLGLIIHSDDITTSQFIDAILLAKFN